MHVLRTVLHAFLINEKAEKENLFNNQELLYLVIIFFILVFLMCDSRMKLWGEITS